ncbi:NAD(P)/FAD-dependent oxidoreductase [Sphingorhabdus sp. EL138]|uniref:flavin-containing monooxygenase n=1 Tax=Sphingorhabdus sp. EL138 TaxID=2073156 RepID=UPI000D69132E|nr:NAD(P)/FAD-dependent oxidoreductase [Sphingorhabdus sp. EL138]
MSGKQNAKGNHIDVLIVGAGISGIGAAWHMQDQCPDKSYLILEKMDSFGGTWLTHKYPGIRSDSDLYTFGYRFKPWTSAPIASGEEILKYMGEVIEENRIDRHIRYGQTITHASWSSEDSLWTVDTVNDHGEKQNYTANFLWMCQGYYSHDKGYTPEWDGMSDYRGQIIHPQTWPEDTNLKDKRVLVIGSGATAATLVPAIAGECEHVALLQRSPTYFWPAQNANELADTLREIELDEELIHSIVRKKALFDQQDLIRRCKEEPEVMKEELLALAREYLGPDFDIEKHFTPKYRPWQQRVAFIPDGDLFQGIAAGSASVVTDEIDRFTEKGILLKSGDELEADIVITATGFNLSVLGDIPFAIDGDPVNWADTITYRGMMFTDIPNLLWVFGYFRASWTLRVDLLGDFVCRLLKHMDVKGAKSVKVSLRPEDKDMEIEQWIDTEDFNPGYLQRGMAKMPRKGAKPIWQHTQDYWREREELPAIDLDGPEFVYGSAEAKIETSKVEVA